MIGVTAYELPTLFDGSENMCFEEVRRSKALCTCFPNTQKQKTLLTSTAKYSKLTLKSDKFHRYT